MTTYIALFNLTDAGIKAAKDSPRRLDAAKKLLADTGGEMKQFYMVMGEFDFVGICEAPDDAVICGRPLGKGFDDPVGLVASVICPACWCGFWSAGLDDIRRLGSLSWPRALGS
jgi:hypothetical protein